MTDQLREKLEIISLVVAVLVVLVALYRYVLDRWRTDIDLRKYPYLLPIPGRTLNGTSTIQVDCPELQRISVHLLDAEDVEVLLINEGPLEAGVHDFAIDTSTYPAGTYYIRLQSAGQVDTRRVEIV